jgi:hypothetical protein
MSGRSLNLGLQSNGQSLSSCTAKWTLLSRARALGHYPSQVQAAHRLKFQTGKAKWSDSGLSADWLVSPAR